MPPASPCTLSREIAYEGTCHPASARPGRSKPRIGNPAKQAVSWSPRVVGAMALMIVEEYRSAVQSKDCVRASGGGRAVLMRGYGGVSAATARSCRSREARAITRLRRVSCSLGTKARVGRGLKGYDHPFDILPEYGIKRKIYIPCARNPMQSRQDGSDRSHLRWFCRQRRRPGIVLERA